MPTLFSPLQLGSLEAPNRIFMAPLTRQRAYQPGDIPGELQAEHYAQRADWAGVQEVSIGDYVLAGGEAAALVMIEAVARLLPGVLGNECSAREDSFAPGEMERRVEGPVYTKPPVWRDLEVPEVLMSGHHGRIAQWRREQSDERTRRVRPDLT